MENSISCLEESGDQWGPAMASWDYRGPVETGGCQWRPAPPGRGGGTSARQWGLVGGQREGPDGDK